MLIHGYPHVLLWNIDDLKEFQGKVYSGMSIGGEQLWEYPCGIWQERKAAPDRWVFTFRSQKRRTRAAPAGSGAPVGTRYHWFILAHMKVRKLDKDTYETSMEGVKYKVAHKRPTGGTGARNTRITTQRGRYLSASLRNT